VGTVQGRWVVSRRRRYWTCKLEAFDKLRPSISMPCCAERSRVPVSLRTDIREVVRVCGEKYPVQRAPSNSSLDNIEALPCRVSSSSIHTIHRLRLPLILDHHRVHGYAHRQLRLVIQDSQHRTSNRGQISERANCETMWCSMAAQKNRVDGTVGAGFKPAYTIAAPRNPPNSPICVVLQLARTTRNRRGKLTVYAYQELCVGLASVKTTIFEPGSGSQESLSAFEQGLESGARRHTCRSTHRKKPTRLE